MDFNTILTRLYYQFIHADGQVNETELAMGENMIQLEKIDPLLFNSEIESLKDIDLKASLTECIAALRNETLENQIKCVAWLCVVANADGFMDRTEWQFIYNIYHKELHLTIDDILAKQKELLHSVRQFHKRPVPVL